MKQEILHIDATPTKDYPIRILKAYREMGNTIWASTTNGNGEIEENIIITTMNDLQYERNALLDKAIETLEKDLEK